MFEYNYSPFSDGEGRKKSIYQIEFNDLTQLKEKEIEEGYQIEYKRELSRTVSKKIPNIITSFANEKGGWVFVGIDENEKSISLIEKQDYELIINNKLRDITSPVPKVTVRFLTSQDDNSKGVLVIFVWEGINPPYISNGKVYRRIGSGSTSINEVTDRYYLDKLYKKSEDKINELNDFCSKEISIYNRDWPIFSKGYNYYGMCNIYVIPTEDLDLLEIKTPEELRQYIINETKKTKQYKIEGETPISMSMPFENAMHSTESIVFRNANLVDAFENTVAWELFFSGASKFHIPIPYKQNIEEINNNLKNIISNYSDSAIFNKFRYIDGKMFLTSILACLGEYMNCLTKLRKDFNEIIIVIDIIDVRRDVLYFDEKLFENFISENGIVFSDKNQYRINKKFNRVRFNVNSFIDILVYISSVFSAFGFSQAEGANIFIRDLFSASQNGN